MTQKSKTVEALPDYNISIRGRHVQVTDAMKDYALEKISKIERFSPRAVDVSVTMDVVRGEHIVDVVLKFNHFKIKAQANTDSMYASIDKVVDKLQNIIRKYKDRIQDHHAKSRAVVEMRVNVLKALSDEEAVNEEIDWENSKQEQQKYALHEIVSHETRVLKVLTQEESVMKMELSQDRFLVYRSEEDMKIKVIYRMTDGNYGVINVE